MAKHFLYTLVFDANPEPVVFYVGHTNDPKRRETEHRSSARDLSNTEYKYRWCRKLDEIGIPWSFVVIGEIEDDEDSEYEWILKFARKNAGLNITFEEGLPLTNMKAGDFLGEILTDRTITTRDEIKEYRIKREQAKTINYQRVKPTPQAQSIIDQELIDAEANRLDNYRTERERVERALKHEQMLNDPERQRKIKTETLRLMLLDRIIDEREYHQLVLEAGGYPADTNTPDKKINLNRK
jgi:hypothetical protein